MHKRISILALSWLLGMTGVTQPLDTLVQMGMRHYPGLQALQYEYRAALEKAPQVNNLPDPEAGLGVFVLPVETRLGPQWVRLGLTQSFPWPGTLEARKEVALADARSRQLEVETARIELRQQIKVAYLELYELDRSRSLTEEAVRYFESLEQRTLTQVEAGKASLAEVMQVRLELAAVRKEIPLIEQQMVKARALLNESLGRSPAAAVDLMDTLLLAVPSDTIPADGHPALQQFEARQEVARRRLVVNKKENQPSVSLGLDYIFVGQRTDADPSGNGRDILAPRIGIKLPICRGKYQARSEEEKHRIAALEWRKRATLDQFRSKLVQAWAAYEEAALRTDLYREQIRLARSALSIRLEQYSATGEGFTDLLRLYLDLIGYERRQLTAIVDSHRAMAQLEWYTASE